MLLDLEMEVADFSDQFFLNTKEVPIEGMLTTLMKLSRLESFVLLRRDILGEQFSVTFPVSLVEQTSANILGYGYLETDYSNIYYVLVVDATSKLF